MKNQLSGITIGTRPNHIGSSNSLYDSARMEPPSGSRASSAPRLIRYNAPKAPSHFTPARRPSTSANRKGEPYVRDREEAEGNGVEGRHLRDSEPAAPG
jgi:hypothetical protein